SENLTLYEEQLADCREELQALKDELERLQTDENDLQNRLQDLLDENDSLKEIIIAKNRSLDAKRNEYNLTKSLVENLEGFPEAIKFLKKSPNFDTSTPLLSDIFTCEDAYKPAIEAFLDNLLGYYVLENTEKALQAIDLLFEAKKGKANFFVLENLKNTNPKVASISGATALLEIVEFDKKYETLFRYLFENVFVAEEADLPQLRKQHPEAVFVAKNAKIVSRSASISGGSVGAFEGKNIGRAKQLETLKQEIETLEAEIADLKEQAEAKQAEISDLKNSSLKEEIRETQILYNKKNEQFISLRTKTEQLATLIENSGEKTDLIAIQIRQAKQNLEEIAPQIEILETELKSLQESNEAETELLEKENDLLSQKLGVFNQQNLKYHQQENRVQSIEQEIKFNESGLENLRNRLQKNNDELSRVSTEIEGLEELAETQDDSLVEMYKQKEAMEKALNEAEKEYYAARGNIDREEKEIRELQRKKENLDLLAGEIQNKINETKLAFASTKERLSVEFNVDLEELMNEENLIISEKTEEELKTEVQRLKNVLDTIGAINPMAMEAYQEINERNNFILAQKDDLVKAKNSLLETITEIDTVAKENFLNTFSAIRQNFQTVFRSLFTEEDTCDLVLVNPENPLESPIDIIAKPKGKRPLTIN
ncbi:MAG: chromosome segregation protein SMC, partial [Raineya sp.]